LYTEPPLFQQLGEFWDKKSPVESGEMLHWGHQKLGACKKSPINLWPKENEMSKNRWRTALIVLTLVMATVLIVQAAAAKTDPLSHEDARKGIKSIECASLPSRHSIHIEVIEETGTRLTHTEDGPTGIDGGLIRLLSDYHTCSR
jgi:hypothetical protein